MTNIFILLALQEHVPKCSQIRSTIEMRYDPKGRKMRWEKVYVVEQYRMRWSSRKHTVCQKIIQSYVIIILMNLLNWLFPYGLCRCCVFSTILWSHHRILLARPLYGVHDPDTFLDISSTSMYADHSKKLLKPFHSHQHFLFLFPLFLSLQIVDVAWIAF